MSVPSLHPVATHGPAEAKFHPDWAKRKGKFVVASDGRRFRVPGYLLKTLSTVFCDLLESDAQPGPLRLTDEVTENGNVFAYVLDLVTEPTLRFEDGSKDDDAAAAAATGEELATIAGAVAFAIKWECAAVEGRAERILLAIRREQPQVCGMLYCCLVAANLETLAGDVLQEAIKHHGTAHAAVKAWVKTSNLTTVLAQPHIGRLLQQAMESSPDRYSYENGW